MVEDHDVTPHPESSATHRRARAEQLAEWLELALRLADAADALGLAAFRRDQLVHTKPDDTLVTDADRAIERMLRERIAARYPDHGIIGEEHGMTQGSADVRWYLDPIDGTHNFVRGIPVWATLIAIEWMGEGQVGVISAPALGTRWWASRGAGAWAGPAGAAARVSDPDPPRALRCSRIDCIERAQLITSSAGSVARSGIAPGLDRTLHDAWRERGFGDFWGYALVAEGAAEAMIEVGPSAWDLAAPAIIVEVAGGILTDVGGTRTIHGGSAIASNGVLHGELLRRLRARS